MLNFTISPNPLALKGDIQFFDCMLEELAKHGSIRTICGEVDIQSVIKMGDQRLRTLVQEYAAWKACRVVIRTWQMEYPEQHDAPWLTSNYFLRKVHCAVRSAVCSDKRLDYYAMMRLDFSMLELFRILGTLTGHLDQGVVPEDAMLSLRKQYVDHPLFLELEGDWRSATEIPSVDEELVEVLRRYHEVLRTSDKEGATEDDLIAIREMEIFVMKTSLMNVLERKGLLNLALLTHTPPSSI